MKKRILFVGVLACGWMSVHAQIRSSFETILLATDKKSYLYTDTMYVSGMLVAADVIMPSGLSNYCVVDVIDDKGKVVALKKVRLRDSFLVSLPVRGLYNAGLYSRYKYALPLFGFLFLISTFTLLIVIEINCLLLHRMLTSGSRHCGRTGSSVSP